MSDSPEPESSSLLLAVGGHERIVGAGVTSKTRSTTDCEFQPSVPVLSMSSESPTVHATHIVATSCISSARTSSSSAKRLLSLHDFQNYTTRGLEQVLLLYIQCPILSKTTGAALIL